eukprot:8483675-Alexandrium_andersonii.AAC.1
MSASLVGSEMCIRDRPPGRASGVGLRRRGRGFDPPLPAPPAAGRTSVNLSLIHILTLPTICSV